MDYYTVGKYNISHICYLTYPCQHNVTNNETGETTLMDGANIMCMLQKDNLSHSHFDMYAELVRKRHNPTEKELSQKMERQQLIQTRMEQQQKEKEEREFLTNKYKASSRLEKLKAKHMATLS